VHLVGLSHIYIQLCQLLKLIQDLFLICKAFTNYCNATYQDFFGNFNEQKLWQFIGTSNTTILTQPHYKLLALFLEITLVSVTEEIWMLSTMKVEARTFIILVCSTVHLNAEKSQILDFSITVHHFLRNTQYLAPKTNFCQQQN